MLLKKVQIVYKLPITCRNCGAVGETQPKKLELLDVDSADIDSIVSRQKVGVSFPVGWAAYHGDPQDYYKCPRCI